MVRWLTGDKTVSDSSNWVDFRAVKDAVTVEAVNNFFTLRLKRVGDEYKGFCPFHEGNGKDTSFSFHADKKAFHCFVCKRKGSVLDFVQQLIAWKENRSCGIKEAGQLLLQVMEEDTYRKRTEAKLEAKQVECAKNPLPVQVSDEIKRLYFTSDPAILEAIKSLGEVSRDVVKGADATDFAVVRVSVVRALFESIKHTLDSVLVAMEAKAKEPHTPQGKPVRRAKKQA